MLSNLSIRYHIPVVLGKTSQLLFVFFQAPLQLQIQRIEEVPNALRKTRCRESGESFHGTTLAGMSYSLKA